MNNRRWLTIALLFFTACAGPYTAAYIVRHAEKVTPQLDPNVDPNDPPLTDAGVARAEDLAKLLGGASVSAVYVTNTKRAKATGKPLADFLGLPLTVYADVPQLAAAVNARTKGKGVLIVGHNNTVPQIVTALGASLPATLSNPIPENDFDNIVLVLINGKDKPGVLHVTYGAPSP